MRVRFLNFAAISFFVVGVLFIISCLVLTIQANKEPRLPIDLSRSFPDTSIPPIIGIPSVGPEELKNELIVLSHSWTQRGNLKEINGEVKNIGTKKWKNIGIEADVFDSKDKYVDKSQTLVNGALSPGERVTFEIVFFNENQVDRYHHYLLKVHYAEKN